MIDLQQEFNNVVKTYFPRWKASSQWRVVDEHPLLKEHFFQGKCIPEEKVIIINLPTDFYLHSIIAHEICHAITTSKYHDEKWSERYNKVAEQAEKLKNVNLAYHIREDLDYYRDGLQDKYQKGLISVEEFLDRRKG